MVQKSVMGCSIFYKGMVCVETSFVSIQNPSKWRGVEEF